LYEDESEGRFHSVMKYNTENYFHECVRSFDVIYYDLLVRITRARRLTPTARAVSGVPHCALPLGDPGALAGLPEIGRASGRDGVYRRV
ncbi:hypothetical protein PUR58_00555, partial [Streptomyces sp. JV186]|uniref:hypothetical protein n=1 Tax=Streptomyces sp. JV186 TaxID=858639 RepID=UPI002E79E5A1